MFCCRPLEAFKISMGVLSRSSKNGGQGIPIALTMGSSIAFVIHSVDRLVLANLSSRSTREV